MIQSRQVGKAKVTRVVEYSAPTHDPAFLFPDLSQSELDSFSELLAPNHYVPEMNRLIITIQIWVVQIDDKVILIDTGVGNNKPRTAPRMRNLNNRVGEWLEAAGAGFDKVTHVIQTHMHADHTGWNTVLKDGEWVPAFPSARYLMPKTDFDYWKKTIEEKSDMAMDNSWSDSVKPVVEAGVVDFIDDDAGKILDCLTVEPVPGHTPGMLGYRLESEDEEAFFCADVFHSPVQILKPELNTAYCVLPEVARETRKRVLEEASERGTLLMPMHFGAPCCGYIRKTDQGYRLEGAEWP